MKKGLPLFLIIASSILIIINFISSAKIDSGFWMSISSSVLIILAMILTIKEQKNNAK